VIEAPRQLVFGFVDDGAEPAARPSRTTAYWRKRLAIVAAKAYALGSMRQRQRRPIPQPPRPHALGADVVTVRVRPTYPCREDRNELHEIADKLARLSISRRDPHAYFESRSELVAVLRAIARRS
jgi:hypothetical protein